MALNNQRGVQLGEVRALFLLKYCSSALIFAFCVQQLHSPKEERQGDV